jgi:hypothetical protein
MEVICEYMGAFVLLGESRSLPDWQVTFFLGSPVALSS